MDCWYDLAKFIITNTNAYTLIELKDGRIPEGITHRMGYWKAEEYQKFCFPASEYVLGDILPENKFHVWITIVRVTELIYGCGRSGFTPSNTFIIDVIICACVLHSLYICIYIYTYIYIYIYVCMAIIYTYVCRND